MTKEMAPKVRLVTCPKCRKLLPEPTGIPIYSCGGCGAILRAKFGPGDAQKKKSPYHALPGNEDSSNLSHEVAVPSPMEHSPNLQKEEDKALSSSIQTVSVESNTEEGIEGAGRICSSTKPSPPFQEPNTDPTISSEKSTEVCSSTDLTSHENQELSPTVVLCSDADGSDENQEFEVVQSEEEPKHDGSVKSLETDYLSIPVDSDSTTRIDSCADGKLKTSEEGNEEPDRICSSTEPSSSFQEPDSDPTISTEKSAEVCSSTELASGENKELSRSAALYSDANGSDENPECVVVHSEEPKHDGSVKSSETDCPTIPVDGDSTTTIDSCADRKLKTLEDFATAEHLEPIPILSKISGEVSHDEIDHQSSDKLVNASINVSEEATTAVSRESIIKERFIPQKQSICCDSFTGYRTMSSKSISTAAGVENSLNERLGMARGGHPAGFRTRLESGELPHHGWSFEVSSTCSEGTLNRKIRDSLYSLTSYPQERSEHILPHDREELLRMVIELENQLKRMRSINEEKSSSSNFCSYHQSNHQFDHPYFHYPYGTTSTYSSSPSTFAWDCETKSDEQMYGYPGLKNSRERTHFPKRHVRPITGACPLITCYNCSELLQIPEDFLLSRRKRCHWLRCGACSVVLRFSLLNRTHITPYTPELDKHDSVHGKNLEGLYRSGGYVIPIRKSFSSEGDPACFVSTETTQDNADYGPRVSNGSTGNSELVIEEASRRKGSSALHRLMGYSSVTQLLS